MRDMYKYLDTKYIKPCLLRDNQYRDPKIIETFENLTNKDAVEFMKRNPTQFAGLKTGGGENGAGFVPPGMASVMGPGKCIIAHLTTIMSGHFFNLVIFT